MTEEKFDRKKYQKEYHKNIWYPKNRKKRIEMVKKNKIKIIQKIRSYKLKLGCSDCGYNKHAEALDFDHIRDKKYNISTLHNKGLSWDKIQEEIDKCEVVCANCHRVRTRKRNASLAK